MGNKQINSEQIPQRGMANPFFQPDVQNDVQGRHVAELLSEFSFKSYYNDPYFQECKVLEHRKSQELIILKEINYKSEVDMEISFAEFQKRKEKLNSDNVIRLRYLLKKSSQGLLSDNFKILLLFDYILTDMHTESHNRIRMNTRFSNEQLSTILAGAIKGYASIERQGIPNDKVRLRNIYFGLKDQIPIVKVADSNLFPSKPNFLAVLANDPDQEDVFLAPEEVRMLSDGQPIIENNKSGVYSLGIAMLELCLQSSSRQIYHYGAKTMNMREVDERLNIVRNKFPLGFFYVLKEMTEKSVDHRVSFQQLEAKLPSNLKNYSPNMTLSVIPRSQVSSAYVKDSVIHQFNSSRAQLINNSQMLNSRQAEILPSRVYASSMVPVNPGQVQSTITSQYRPIDTLNLHQVNEVYTSGNTYKGQKNVQEERHGKGKYTYSDGSFYYGDWYKNKMFGNGTLYYPDKSVEYDGEWRDDMFEGRGVLYGKGCDWIKYEGEFKAGKMEGFGVMAFNDGNIYTGAFKNDRPHGRGRMTGRDIVRTGVWENGKMLGVD